MSTMPFSEARSHLTDLVNIVAYRKKRIVLTRKGKRMVAIVPLDDFEALEALEDEIDIMLARKAEKDIKKHGTISWEKVKRELGL